MHPELGFWIALDCINWNKYDFTICQHDIIVNFFLMVLCQGHIESFLARGTYIKSMKAPSWLVPNEYIFKIVPPYALKMHFLTLSLLRFFCKTFSELLKLTLRSTISRGWFLKNSYIHKQNLYGYQLVRAAKQPELKRCSN